MSAILLLWGFLVTAAGVLALGYGIPLHDSIIGQTLLIGGVIGLIGGPMLVGLSLAISRLTEIGTGFATLKAKPAAAAWAADVEPVAVKQQNEAPPPAAPVAFPAAAIVQLRPSMVVPSRIVTNGEDVPLSPNSGQQLAEPKTHLAPEPHARSGAADEAHNEPRLDFLFRSRAARSTRPESFNAAWQKRATPESPRQSGTDDVVRQQDAVPAVEETLVPPALVPAEVPRAATVLKSGVVDGMAYTLYADGSIEAQLAQGMVRFDSIAALRAHIEKNS
jgi:hypothetical protein